jgi:6-phosphogluconolactonase
MEQSTYVIYFGSYAEKSLSSLYAYKFDENTEELTFVESISGLKDPSFIKVSESNGVLYTFTQADEEDEKAAVVAYAIEPSSGKLTRLGQQAAAGKSATHINTDQANQLLMTVSYGEGSVSVFPLQTGGRIEPLCENTQHVGKSINAKRQESAHPHSIFTDPSDRFVVVPDLGLDKIIVYRINREQKTFELHDEVDVTPGSGPRHFVFHPSGAFAYVIQELNSTITAFSYDKEKGKLEAIQIVNTLPDDYVGDNSCAEIQISPCGGFLYGSNRGHDSIAVFSINAATGKLGILEHTSTLGKHPRHFSLTPSGRFLVVANKDTDSVNWFKVDKDTGKLQSTGQHISIIQPTCVRFFPLT